MKKAIATTIAALSLFAANARTLIVYYSYTNNIHTIAEELRAQTNADVVRIEPAEKGLDYAADNYAIGSSLISAIRSNPGDPASYPAIDPVDVDLAAYDMVFIGVPLWWSSMAAPMQTFLFQNGDKLAGKKIGLIVSSASSGISGVDADARRLVPAGDFVEPSLWIRSSQTSGCRSMISEWLEKIDYRGITTGTASVNADNAVRLEAAEGGIHIEGDVDSLSLCTLSGTTVAQASSSFLPVSGIAPGIYIARIRAGGKELSRKVAIR